jgi:SsrA-binding protein
MSTLSENKKAYHDYEILEKFEAGISLNGQEVKSIKLGRGSIKGSYITFSKGEAFLTGAVVPPYQPKNAPKDYNDKRERKLLLQKKELKHLIGKKEQKGLTFIPLKIYTKGRIIKLEIAIVKGKKTKDIRETIKKRDFDRDKQRFLKNN